MDLKDEKTWREYETKNTDPYGKQCVDVARNAMEILDKGDHFDAHQLICDADNGVGGGITGFMAGCVAQMIIQCHVRGDEFKKKWNKYYGKEGADGVVNPAIITIDVKEDG